MNLQPVTTTLLNDHSLTLLQNEILLLLSINYSLPHILQNNMFNFLLLAYTHISFQTYLTF